MRLWQRIKNAFKVANFEHTPPFARTALEREVRNASSSHGEAVGTIHRFDVAARGFFKRRTLFKDKLFGCSISRYFILKLGAFYFCIGQFFLSRFVSISEYFDLILEQGNPFTQDGVTFDSREQIKRGFCGSENCGNIHSESLNVKESSNFKQKQNFDQ